MVESEVINDDEKHLLTFVNEWEHLIFEDISTKQRPIIIVVRLLFLLSSQFREAIADFVVLWCYPIKIVLRNVFSKTIVGFFLLHLQHLGHIAISTA